MSAQSITQATLARTRVLVAAHDPGVVPDPIIAAPDMVGKVSARAFLYALLGPGSAALNVTGHAQVDSVSCAPAGNCAAGGTYDNHHARLQAFVVSQN